VAGEPAAEAARLLADERWAALATLHEGAPLASMVAYAHEPGTGALLLHLSGLSAHTRDLLEDPRASLVVGRPDPGAGDPQTLPRLTLSGHAEVLEEGGEAHDRARAAYIERFPAAETRFQLPDFVLFRFVPEDARWVGGLGRAARFPAARLRDDPAPRA